MKNFDIEQLERKNIYKVPDGFFNEMQAEVLKNITGAAPRIPLQAVAKQKSARWWYAAAAVVAVSAGIGGFFAMNDRDSAPKNAMASHDEDTRSETLRNDSQYITVAKDDQEIIPAQVLPAEQNLTLAANNNRTYNERQPVQTVKDNQRISIQGIKTKTVAITYPNEQIAEDLVSSLSKEDLADVGQNTENDLYLDLY